MREPFSLKRALLAAALAFACWRVYAGPVPQKNKFTGPVQVEDGPVCSNVDPTGDIFDFKPCADNTDVVAQCTSGNLMRVREASGDRYILRCLNQGSTLDYSAAKYLLDDTASYADATVATQTYRGVDLRGSLTLTNASTSGGGDLCPDTVNLISNPEFDTWISSTNADKWADTHLCGGGVGDTCDSQNASVFHSTPYALNLYTTSSSDGSLVQSRDRTSAYMLLAYNTTYTVTWWYYVGASGNGKYANWTVWELAALSDLAPVYSLRSGTGGVPDTWSASEGTCVSDPGAYPYVLMNGDSTFHQVTETFTTRAGSGTFYAALVFCNGGTGVAGTTYVVDDIGMCIPGNAVDASAVTVRGLTEDQLAYVPTVPNANDTLEVGPFIGADLTPRIAPSAVTDASITQDTAIGTRTGLHYTAPTGSYTLDNAYSLYVEKPEVGTTRYGAYIAGETALDPAADGTAAYVFKEDTCTNGQVLTYTTVAGGIKCEDATSSSCVSYYDADVNSDATSITVTISAGSQVLEIEASVRSTCSDSTSCGAIQVEYNGDTTAANYLSAIQFAGPSDHQGDAATTPVICGVNASHASSVSNAFSTIWGRVYRPDSTTALKNAIWQCATIFTSASYYTAQRATIYNSTSAITSIKFSMTSGSIKAGSHISVRGLGACS